MKSGRRTNLEKEIEMQILSSNLRSFLFHRDSRNKHYVYLVPGFLIIWEILLKTDFGKSAHMLICIENTTFCWTHIHKCFSSIQKQNFLKGLFSVPALFSMIIVTKIQPHSQIWQNGSQIQSICTSGWTRSPYTILPGSHTMGHLKDKTRSSRPLR